MNGEFITFLATAVFISLSGVMSPGAMTAAAIGHGAGKRFSGVDISLGHAVVEIPLIALLALGAGSFFEDITTRIAIGFAGGAYLLYMGIGMIKPAVSTGDSPISKKGSAFAAGIMLSITNPYFLLWWATIGLGLVIGASKFGYFGIAIFAVVHWLCDLVWFAILSWLSHRGVSAFGSGAYVRVSQACGAALFFFGAAFILKSISLLYPDLLSNI